MDAELTQTLRDLASSKGAVATGVATTDTLSGGPPSADLTYVLPGAKSAVSFAMPMDPQLIETYLGKKDRLGHESDNYKTNYLASRTSYELASFLTENGHEAAPLASNAVYRDDEETRPQEERPPVSHRYLAVRSGVGHYGLSGNLITKEHGACVILGSVVTTAELVSTDPLPPEDNYCDDCGMCQAACLTGFVTKEGKQTVTLGGVEFSHAKRPAYIRCGFSCGGFTGLHPSGKWSTWSPGRFAIPKRDEEFPLAIGKAIQPYLQRPQQEGGTSHPLMPGKRIEHTCGNCQLVCHPDKNVRAKRLKLLTAGGVIIQHPDGVCQAVTPEEARAHLDAMPPEIRARYEEAPVSSGVQLKGRPTQHKHRSPANP